MGNLQDCTTRTKTNDTVEISDSLNVLVLGSSHDPFVKRLKSALGSSDGEVVVAPSIDELKSSLPSLPAGMLRRVLRRTDIIVSCTATAAMLEKEETWKQLNPEEAGCRLRWIHCRDASAQALVAKEVPVPGKQHGCLKGTPEKVTGNKTVAGALRRSELQTAPKEWHRRWDGANTRWTDQMLTATTRGSLFAQRDAEWALAAMLHFSCDMPRGEASQRQGLVTDTASMRPLNGKRLRILGGYGQGGHLGRTTQLLRDMCVGLGMDVRIGTLRRHRPFSLPGAEDVSTAGAEDKKAREEIVDCLPSAALKSFLRDADVLLLAACPPRNSSAAPLLDERSLRFLIPTAIVVSLCDTRLLDFDAIKTALTEGWISAMAVNFTVDMPVRKGHPLWGDPRCLLSCRCGEADVGALVSQFLELLTHFRNGWEEMKRNPAELPLRIRDCLVKGEMIDRLVHPELAFHPPPPRLDSEEADN